MRQQTESGQTTLMMALFLGTFLFGFVALGVDLGYMFRAKRMAAADAAALAAMGQACRSIPLAFVPHTAWTMNSSSTMTILQ